MKHKIRKIPVNENGSDEKGILASIIFLKGEAKKAQMPHTEEALHEAIAALFKDLQNLGKLDENMEMIQGFLNKVLTLEKEELANFIKLIEFFDDTNTDEISN